MFNFDEARVRQEHQNGVDIIPKTEKIIDQVCEEGYSNIFYIGIGGTVLYANQMMHIAKQLGSRLPIYIENAADFNLVGNPLFDSRSIVVIESISGDTKEVVESVEKVRAAGARVIGYVEKEGTPLYELCDHLVTTVGGGYYFWYTVTLRFMKNAGQFDKYDQFFKEIVHMPDNIVQVYKDADEDAKAYAEKYCDEPITYLVGSGNLEDWAVCYGMCIMEEMQWMRTRPISAANFFHGTLEVIERDIPVILIKGEDMTRPQMERVEKFVNKVSAKVIVFDTKKFRLDGISDEFRGILAPIVMRSAFQRINVHLEHYRRHPLAIRRYYKRLDY
ncbi:SIS domain-containing protein [Lacrimispora sp.]|uniref:SIS domain-containing protein n=1 Tax=Lacrimispora sp. TaxID=2719234 RepID=UPI002FDA99A1